MVVFKIHSATHPQGIKGQLLSGYCLFGTAHLLSSFFWVTCPEFSMRNLLPQLSSGILAKIPVTPTIGKKQVTHVPLNSICHLPGHSDIHGQRLHFES